MARVSKPLVLSEADLAALQELRKHGDKDASLRAEIVIACADERTNKSIAQELSVTEATVKKWKEAFREKGLDGLVTEHTGGRKPSSPTPAGLEQAIMDIVNSHANESLTASAIAEQLQVDVGKVYYVLRKNGINLNRNRNWEYVSRDDMGGWDPPIICLYLSPSCSCIVASSNPWPKENRSVQGVFVTRDKALEDELERSLIRVSLLGILKTASRISIGSSARTPKPGPVIEEAIAQWDTDGEAEFFIFCSGDTVSYEGKRSKQSHIYHHGSLDEMKTSFLHWMGGRCNADQHAKAEILLTEICRFCGQQQTSNAFVWYLRHNEMVQCETGTEGMAASDMPLEGDDALVLPKAESWTSVEEMLNALLPGMDSSEPMTEAGAILYHRGKDGRFHCSHVPSSQKFQDMEEFSFESKESFERDLSRLEKDTEGFLREVAEANYGMFLAGAKKKQNLTGVFLRADVEMLKGRMPLVLSAELVRTLNTNGRFKTSSYRRKVALLCTYVSYRTSLKVFNEMTGRDGFECPIPLQTFVSDFIEEGQAIRKGKQTLAQQILLQNGFDLNMRYVKDSQLPMEWVNNGDMMVTITGNNPPPALIDDWDQDNPRLEPSDELIVSSDEEAESHTEEEIAKKLYSEPDMKKFIPVKRRRRSRVQVSEAEIEEVCNGYVDWFNGLGQENFCKIVHTWVIEKASNDIVYIMIDAVYVTEQAERHIKGGKPEEKKKKDRIHHWNIAVEVDDTRYALTATERNEVYQQLFAFLLKNDLMGRYFTFMIDGERAIFDDIDLYFRPWKNHTILLDWYHVEEKAVQKLSSAITHKMVPDPRSEDGKKNTALSNLYSRKLLSILWVGNVNEGIKYCQNIDPGLIKNQAAMDELITYLTNKGKYITCYALRRRAGLRNSSNGSENVNDVTVARRQKDDNKAWRETGSSSASNISCLFYNGEDNLWFSKGELTYDILYKKQKDEKSRTEKAEQNENAVGVQQG